MHVEEEALLHAVFKKKQTPNFFHCVVTSFLGLHVFCGLSSTGQSGGERG